MANENLCLDEALTVLRTAGIQPQQIEGGKHIKLQWEQNGKSKTVSIPRTTSDHRAHLNVRSQIRNMLKEDGMITQPNPLAKEKEKSLFHKAMEHGKDPLLHRLDRIEAELRVFTDLILDASPSLKSLSALVKAEENGIPGKQPEQFLIKAMVPKDNLGAALAHLALAGVALSRTRVSEYIGPVSQREAQAEQQQAQEPEEATQAPVEEMPPQQAPKALQNGNGHTKARKTPQPEATTPPEPESKGDPVAMLRWLDKIEIDAAVLDSQPLVVKRSFKNGRLTASTKLVLFMNDRGKVTGGDVSKAGFNSPYSMPVNLCKQGRARKVGSVFELTKAGSDFAKKVEGVIAGMQKVLPTQRDLADLHAVSGGVLGKSFSTGPKPKSLAEKRGYPETKAALQAMADKKGLIENFSYASVKSVPCSTAQVHALVHLMAEAGELEIVKPPIKGKLNSGALRLL